MFKVKKQLTLHDVVTPKMSKEAKKAVMIAARMAQREQNEMLRKAAKIPDEQ